METNPTLQRHFFGAFALEMLSNWTRCQDKVNSWLDMATITSSGWPYVFLFICGCIMLAHVARIIFKKVFKSRKTISVQGLKVDQVAAKKLSELQKSVELDQYTGQLRGSSTEVALPSQRKYFDSDKG